MHTEGYCQCGCGGLAPIAKQSVTKLGWVKGQPLRFIRGHANRKQTPDYVEQSCGHETPCWIGQRAITSSGYCLVTRDKRFVLLHRWHWEQANGPIPEGLEIDHLCRVRACCNPSHLEPVTREENQRRGLATKLTADDVRAIRSSTASRAEMAAQYGVTPENIWAIRKRRTWKDIE